jgi:hypothetical protein
MLDGENIALVEGTILRWVNSSLFGMETNKIVYYQHMSMRCRKCEHNVVHDPRLCSHNYTGSAKGMEPHAAVKCIESIFSKGDVIRSLNH